jgi:hypothetical protein
VDDYARQLVEANLPTGRGKAPALTVKDARRIAESTPATLAGRRDLAIALRGFAIAARRCELAARRRHHPGRAGPVRPHPLLQDKAPTPCRPLYGQNESTCPVRAWRAWQEVSGITHGPAFRRINRHGQLLGAMSPAAIGAVIARARARAGLDLHLTGHSVRAGLASEARRAGHDTATIADQGGWARNSTALQEHIRIVDQWTDNALAGIGL